MTKISIREVPLNVKVTGRGPRLALSTVMPDGRPQTSEITMSERISTNGAQHALDLVRAIRAQVGPGLPGTPQG